MKIAFNIVAQNEHREVFGIKDSQSNKYQLTINNPVDHGFNHDKIHEILRNNFKTLVYYCLADEKGSCYHTHIFIVFSSRVRVSTIHRNFLGAHIEIAKGSISDNVNYIKKKENGKMIKINKRK